MKFLASVLQIVIASRPLPLVYAASTNDGTRKFDASPTKAIQSTTGKKPTIVNNYSTSQQQLQLQDLNLLVLEVQPQTITLHRLLSQEDIGFNETADASINHVKKHGIKQKHPNSQCTVYEHVMSIRSHC